MREKIIILLILMLSVLSLLQGEELKISLKAGECLYAVQLLNGVEIYGEEIENFVATKEFFYEEVKKAEKSKKQMKDEISLKVPLEVAQGFISYTRRSKISGADADLYYGIVQKILESAKKKK